MGGLVLVGRLLQHLGRSGGALLRYNWQVLFVLAVWMTALWVLLTRRDVLIQLPMEHPLFPFQDILIIGIFDFVKLVLIGIMVGNIRSKHILDAADHLPETRFMPRWIVISFVFAVCLAAINAVQVQLEFGGAMPLEPAAAIAVKLGSVYLGMIVLWAAVYFYVAARQGVTDLIVATTIVYLVPAGLITTLILYTPVVAPFWFGLDQLGGAWNALVQSVSVVAETCAALIYAVFIAGASIWLAENKDAGCEKPAS